MREKEGRGGVDSHYLVWVVDFVEAQRERESCEDGYCGHAGLLCLQKFVHGTDMAL